VDVAAHLRELAAGFASRAAALNLRFTAGVEPTGLRVVDPDRLTQVVANLVENALRYTPEAGEVDLTVGTAGNVVHVVVRDNGPGIDPDDLPRIFEKFFVAQKYRRVRPEGSGLGLSIVAQLMEKMGGTVNADSRPGAGTTISVALPAPVA
jgi:signal transduction histidine kinase